MRGSLATLLILLTFVLSGANAQAKEYCVLSMVGTSQYNCDSTALSYANPDVPKGSDLKQASIGSFDTLNPLAIKGSAADGLNLTTDRLMARIWDEPFTLVPAIAEKVDLPDDRSSITFMLNKNARFHDGSPITADDVLFSYETLKESGRPNMRRIYKLATPEKIDAHTIKFTFGEGHDRETAMIMAIMPVLSKAYWTGKEFDKTTLDVPLGSGPYKISSVDQGKQIIYERVKEYWAADSLANKGHHNFDRIIYDYYRDNTVALESFKKGDLDLRREWNAGNWNSNYNFPAVTKGDVIKAEIKHGRAEKVRGFIFNTRRAPFDDIRVREALTPILDFDWINKNFFYNKYLRIGHGALLDGTYFPNTALGYQPDTSTMRLTKDRRTLLRTANATLNDAGWIIQDGKRINEKTKEVMAFEIILDNPSDEKIALAYTRELKKMGIDATVRIMDTAAFRDRLNNYDFDMTLYFWHSTLSPGTEQYLRWSCEAAKTPFQWNFAGICDPEIDELAKAIPAAKTRDELIEKTRALDKKLQAGQYMVPLYYNPYDYIAHWDRIERPETTPLYGPVIETWWSDAIGANNPD